MGEVVEVQPGTSEAQGLLARVTLALARGRWRDALGEGRELMGLARAAARGRAPFEVALGDGLDELDRRGGLVTLGRSGVGDVGLEDLDVSAPGARRMRRDAVELRQRPFLRAAVLSGEVTLRKAEVLLRLTRRSEDAYWTARAKVVSVWYLEAQAGKGAREDWVHVQLTLPPGEAAVLQLALDIARVLEGGGTTQLRQMECVLMEFVSSYPPPFSASAPLLGQEWGRAEASEAPVVVAAAVESEEAGETVAQEVGGPFDAYGALARLKTLAAQRACVEETLRRACLLVKKSRAYFLVGAPSFRAWCEAWLGLPYRTANHGVQLQEALDAVPEVDGALKSGVLTRQKALSVGETAMALNASAEEVAALVAEAAARPAVNAQRRARAAREKRHRQVRPLAGLRLAADQGDGGANNRSPGAHGPARHQTRPSAAGKCVTRAASAWWCPPASTGCFATPWPLDGPGGPTCPPGRCC